VLTQEAEMTICIKQFSDWGNKKGKDTQMRTTQKLHKHSQNTSHCRQGKKAVV
jgi:hypothetical protein